jgi:ornithine cyclodeaminase
VVDSARECAARADLLVTTTTATEGYIGFDWLRPGALVAHVSLSDLLPEVITRADLVMVDDWELVSHDRRRLLGLMYGAGDLLPPGAAGEARAVDGTLGDVLTGRHPGRGRVQDIVVSNPFGMAILDLAVAREVLAVAVKHGLGVQLPR